MIRRIVAVFATILVMFSAVTIVANATQKDPFGDPEAPKPEIGDMFRFDQNMTLSSTESENCVEVTPSDICYMVSGANARGLCRIYVDGMDPSTKVYTCFWLDTEFTVIQNKALIVGDLNTDASVDSFDLVLARRFLIDFIEGSELDGISVMRADMNQDGNFNIADLVALQRFLLGYNDKDEVAESDYTASKSISPNGFAGSSNYLVSLFSNGDVTINSKLYAVNVIDIGLDVDSQGIVMKGGQILGESQKGWIRQADEDEEITPSSSEGTTVKPTGFLGASQHFVCLTGQNQVYIDGVLYADGVEQIYVETDTSSQNFGAVMCIGGEWLKNAPGWVIIE